MSGGNTRPLYVCWWLCLVHNVAAAANLKMTHARTFAQGRETPL